VRYAIILEKGTSVNIDLICVMQPNFKIGLDFKTRLLLLKLPESSVSVISNNSIYCLYLKDFQNGYISSVLKLRLLVDGDNLCGRPKWIECAGMHPVDS